MDDAQKILDALAEIKSIVDVSYSSAMLGFLGVVIGATITSIPPLLNNFFARRHAHDDRMRTAYDDVINRLAEAGKLHLQSRVWNVVPGSQQSTGEFVDQNAFEEIQLIVADVKGRNSHVIAPKVIDAMNKILALPYEPVTTLITDSSSLPPIERKKQVVPLYCDLQKMLDDVRTAIRKQYPGA